MNRRASAWLPCASDFEAGDFWRGGAGVVMQTSLVLWPLAYRMARRAAARRAMEARLRHVAAAYAVGRPAALPASGDSAVTGAPGGWPAAA